MTQDEVDAAVKAELEELLKLERHPRSFKGAVVPVDFIVVPRFRSVETGALYVAEPTELEAGKGETPERDLFLRKYTTVGEHQGVKLVDIFTAIAGTAGNGGVWGLLPIALEAIRKKR